MFVYIALLVLSLIIILLCCELFTNGIEWLGKKLNAGDGVIGSIFSAVGTCLPETMVPVIAILFSSGGAEGVDIGIGAIVGAPFMLSTLAFFVTGASVLVFSKKRKTGLRMKVNNNILGRDLIFFAAVYSIGIMSSFVGVESVRQLTAFTLILYYIYYVFLTVRHDQKSVGSLEMLYVSKYIKISPNILSILFQIALAISGIIAGAHIFVENLKDVSNCIGISTLVLSLVITPIATELPEKFNSIIWISKKKDTLALGNITGAMVFQSCIPVSIGILATSWQLDAKVVFSALLSLLSALFVYLWIKARGGLSALPLLAGGIFYMVFIAFVF
ncbi:MAG: sodium:calcium antiporter [Clostridia bacterium]|nr:sodium:calcium antiporter [Clostridia bacterium]